MSEGEAKNDADPKPADSKKVSVKLILNSSQPYSPKEAARIGTVAKTEQEILDLMQAGTIKKETSAGKENVIVGRYKYGNNDFRRHLMNLDNTPYF